MLRVENLHSGYGSTKVLRGVTLDVPEGSIVALLGRNGAGKSTLLSTITGFVTPSSGSVSLDGAGLRPGDPRRAVASGIGMVPESRSLFTQLTARDNLAVAGGRKRRDLERVVALFPELDRLMDRRAGLLSGGEQQMLAIARAFVRHPRFLLVDEMSMGLAPVICNRLVSALHRAALDEGVGILMVEQHLHLALSAADQGYVMRRGEITYSGSAKALEANLEEVRAAYIPADADPNTSLATGAHP